MKLIKSTSQSMRLLLALALLLSTAPATALLLAQTPQNATEKKLDALLARMTLAEKLGQLQMLDGEANGAGVRATARLDGSSSVSADPHAAAPSRANTASCAFIGLSLRC